MRRILVFQHVPHEILGTLDPLLRSCGFRIRYVNFGRDPGARPALERYHGLIVLGGPMSAYDDAGHPHLATEVDLIREALGRDRTRRSASANASTGCSSISRWTPR